MTDASRYAKLLSEAYFLTVLSSELEVDWRKRVISKGDCDP